ncbi:MAG: AMP-binding protein [Planctomycetales bacterium]|jgi:long-chain acyl-CoA synthetase
MTKTLQTLEASDRPWLDQYPAIVPRTLDYPELYAWGLLERTASRHPDRIACHYYKQTVTYRELAENARRTASALVKFGVKPGDRVGVLLPNLPEYLSVLNGIWMAGGIAVAMSPLMVAEEIDTFMTTTDCRVVIALDMLAPLIVNAKYNPEHILFATLGDRLPTWQKVGYAFARLQRLGFWPAPDHPTHHSLEDQVAAGDADFQPVEAASRDEPAYILPTGGTTGAPKAVTLSHRNLIANAWQIYNWGGAYEAREKILTVLPFFHSYGLTSCAMSGVAMAATLVIHHRFVPRIVLRLIEEHQPSIFPAVPAMLAALNDVLRDKPVQFKALRYVVSGGAPLSDEISNEFARYSGATLVEGYGMSEASPVICTGPLDGTNRSGTIGLPLPDTDVRVVGEDGQTILPPGEIGELVTRGPQVMLGYWQNEAATSEVIRDGWLYTGDMGTCDEDGFFRVVDRKKDLVITSGFNVYPADVEPVLKGAPGVEDVVIVGEPDVRVGEVVKAIVSVRAAGAFDRAAFDAFATEHLAKHKCPKIVEVVVGELPKNFLGKVLRRKLRAENSTSDEGRDTKHVPASTVSVAGSMPDSNSAVAVHPAPDLKE